jgi:hypothetical protein
MIPRAYSCPTGSVQRWGPETKTPRCPPRTFTGLGNGADLACKGSNMGKSLKYSWKTKVHRVREYEIPEPRTPPRSTHTFISRIDDLEGSWRPRLQTVQGYEIPVRSIGVNCPSFYEKSVVCPSIHAKSIGVGPDLEAAAAGSVVVERPRCCLINVVMAPWYCIEWMVRRCLNVSEQCIRVLRACYITLSLIASLISIILGIRNLMR